MNLPRTVPAALAVWVATALGAPVACQEPEGETARQENHVRAPLPSPEEIAKLPPDGGPEFNRLIFEQSPYLLQHARNPVDWYPWGAEAFRAAQAQDRPIFLSIGYSTCHWCHVMEHESFEDSLVADLMNEAFVCIKLDREERPDLDHLYMTITQAMNNGQGGWPMTVVLTPDRKPIFAATYIPKTGRYGRWGMVDLVPKISEDWRENRDQIVERADYLVGELAKMVHGTPGSGLGADVLQAAYSHLAGRFDERRAGFGTQPKFPMPHNLRFLLRHHARTGDARALEMVERTLQEMRKGGIWDHVGFGLHRYSTDRRWLLPHFEKMLYDQALLAMALVETWQVTGKQEYESTAREVLTYVTRDMTSPEGGFYSAEDADSEGEEGLFYVWTVDELVAVLGEEDAPLAIEVWGVEEGGNFHDQTSGEKTGRSILYLGKTLDAHAAERGEEPAKFAARMESIRSRLFTVREARIHPLKDDKILTDWNGLMIGAFAMAARAFDDEQYAAIARRAADHLLTTLRREDGRLYKLARLGRASGSGLLEDYAFAALGLIELFETVQDPRYLKAAVELTDRMIEDFHDAERGGFYLAPDDDAELIVRPKEIYDGAIPSGNSVAAGNLVRLGRLTGQTRYEELAQGTFAAFSGDVRRGPGSHPQLMLALDFAVGPTHEIVIAGDPAAEDTRDMLRAVHAPFLPNKVVVLRPDEAGEAIAELVPYVAEQRAVDGRATIYVCENFTCQAPTHDVEAALASVGRRADGGDD